MDKRINAAAVALPKLDLLIKNFLGRIAPKAGEIICTDEELFYDPENNDIYVALTFLSRLTDTPSQKQLVARIPISGQISILDVNTLLEKDLEDISHLAPAILIQMIQNSSRFSAKLRTAVQAMILDETSNPICKR